MTHEVTMRRDRAGREGWITLRCNCGILYTAPKLRAFELLAAHKEDVRRFGDGS